MNSSEIKKTPNTSLINNGGFWRITLSFKQESKFFKSFHDNDRGLKVFEMVSLHEPPTSLKVPK